MAQAKFFKNPIKWMFNREVDDRTSLGINLTPSDNEEKQALVQEVATLKAQLDRISIQNKQKIDENKKEDKEAKIKKDLKEQENEIIKNRYSDTTSLGKIFIKAYLDRKFRDNFKIMDKDGIEEFGKFGDIVITKNRGTLLLTDSEGNPVIESKSIDGIIHKPESLEYQLSANRILIALDKDRKPVIDYDDVEVNEIEYDPDTGKYFQSKQARRKAKEIILEKMNEINEKNDTLEATEMAYNRILRQLNDLTRANNVLKNQADTTQSELTQAMGLTMQFNSKIGQMQTQITNLTELKSLYERKITAHENIYEKIMDKLEQAGNKTLYEQVKLDIQTDIETYKNLLPETIYQQPEPPKDENLVKPGAILEASKVK